MNKMKGEVLITSPFLFDQKIRSIVYYFLIFRVKTGENAFFCLKIWFFSGKVPNFASSNKKRKEIMKKIKCHLWCYSITGNVYDKGIYESRASALREARDNFWHGYYIKELKNEKK